MAVWSLLLTAVTLLGPAVEILNGIRYVRPGGDFQPNITLFRKVDVNGAKEHPLFAYLKRSCPTTRDFFMPSSRLDYSPMRNSDVRWNFEKFLVNRKGKPVKRYDASSRVSDMREDIESLISLDVNDPNIGARDLYDTPNLNRSKHGGDLEKRFETQLD
ncbi:hypothetical protein GHT06_015729 [Daphnia sinensis]|uniref:Glutathione peroxidase n=1 Tax=Daphnia sinensis TaxID=1820382 RepID=A0AAD5LA99_9CRUS|nr:hypothetical protein GHT06_015729 [Daphnia sinensis]